MRLTSIVHILSPETDNCPSWISGRERMTVENISWSIFTDNCPSWISERERMTVENISWSIFTKECCRSRRGWTRDLLVSSRTPHPTEPPRPGHSHLHRLVSVRVFRLRKTNTTGYLQIGHRNSDQTAHMRSLIWVFAERTCHTLQFRTSGSNIIFAGDTWNTFVLGATQI